MYHRILLLLLCFSAISATSALSARSAHAEEERVSIPRFTATLGTPKEDLPKIIELCKAHFDRLECKQPELFDAETPARKVVIKPFQLDTHEVTNARYLACLEEGACTPVDVSACRIYDVEADNWKGKSLTEDHSQPNHPAVCVTWDQANAFCAWAGGSLPTEQQWEAAARGPDGLIFPWGNEFDQPGAQDDEPTEDFARPYYYNRANWGDFGPRDTHRDALMFGAQDDHVSTAPVGSFDNASPFGARDMAGNVWEWTASDYPDAKPDKANRPQKVYRGGGYLSNPAYIRAAFRDFASPSYSASHLGFRCAY